MQGVTELAILGIVFLGLQVWWLNKVFLNGPRTPKSVGKTMQRASLQDKKNNLQKLFDQS